MLGAASDEANVSFVYPKHTMPNMSAKLNTYVRNPATSRSFDLAL
jgi:hypothetical protein